MTDDAEPRHVPVGLLRVRNHCTFTWRGAVTGAQRRVEVLPDHCAECIAEVRRRGLEVIYVAACWRSRESAGI